MDKQKLVLSAADWVIFVLTLLIPTAMGFFFRFSGGKQKTNEEFLLAGRNMAILPVAVSLMASCLSSTTQMGLPADVYLYGISLTFFCIGLILGPVLSAYIFLPVYFETGVSTAYEYLEKRFGKTLRRVLSIAFVIQFTFYSAVILYAPALALSAVTNLPMKTAIIAVGVVCTCYTTLAGMKAIVWADVFQTILMFTCTLVVLIKGSIDLGGITNVFNIANEGGRLSLPSLSLDLETRYTLLTLCLQSTVLTGSIYSCTQIQVQRMLTLKNVERSRSAILWSIPLMVIYYFLVGMCGIVIYAYFRSCDPMTSPTKPIHSPDQLLPFYITSTMSQFPGLPGVCIAGVFSSSLSSLSSTINSLAAVTSKDLIQPFWPNLQSVTVTKILSFIFGVLSVILSFVVGSFGNLIKTTFTMTSTLNGPTFGVYFLAVLTKGANEEGAILGAVTGVVVSAFISFTSSPEKKGQLPVSSECPGLSAVLHQTQSVYNSTDFTVFPNEEFQSYFPNSTVIPTSSTSHDDVKQNPIYISFMWIGPLSVITCLLMGYIASFVAGYFHKTPREVPNTYLSPIILWFSERSKKRCVKKAATARVNCLEEFTVIKNSGLRLDCGYPEFGNNHLL